MREDTPFEIIQADTNFGSIFNDNNCKQIVFKALESYFKLKIRVRIKDGILFKNKTTKYFFNFINNIIKNNTNFLKRCKILIHIYMMKMRF